MRVEARALLACLALLLICQAATKAVESSAQVEVRHFVQTLSFVRACCKSRRHSYLPEASRLHLSVNDL